MAQALRAGLRNGGIRRGGLRPGLGNGSLFSVAPLDLFFARTRTLDPRITFTRASSGTYVGSDGLLKTATTNEPRFDHNPTTGESLGLLVEETRTNSIRNNTMVGAVAGTPGTLPTNWVQSALAAGLTANVLGTGTNSGINYIDIRISGTTADAVGWSVFTNASTQIAASSGQSWTGSVYGAIIGGSTTNITQGNIRVVERNSGGGYITESNASWTAATSALASNRFSVARTLGGTVAFVQFGFYFQANSGVAIDITLRIGMPQLEQGAFATSVIPTSGTAATRSADVASITGANFSSWYRQDEGTFYGDAFRPFAVPAPDFPLIADSRAGTDRIQFGYLTEGLASAYVQVGNVGQTEMYPGSGNARNRKVAFAAAVNNFGATCNGAAVLTDTSGTMPTAMVSLGIGSHTQNGQYLNGTIRRLTYWPQRLSNSTMQDITR